MQKTRDETPRVHELVGLFDDPEKLYAAVSELEGAGVNRAEMSILARDEDPTHPSAAENSRRAADDPEAPRQSPITDTDTRQGRTLATSLGAVIAAFAASGLTVMTGGAAAAAIATALAAGGGVAFVGTALGVAAGERKEAFLQEQIERGGILLWVKIRDAAQERRARDILERHGAANVHAHDIRA